VNDFAELSRVHSKAKTPTPQQAKTFRRFTSAEHERFKQGCDRPQKAKTDKAKPITFHRTIASVFSEEGCIKRGIAMDGRRI
jgi:hypothetical protein